MDIGSSNLIPNQKYSEFKMLVVRRKLSQITNDYNFDNDYDTNVATAECYIDHSGDSGVGLYRRPTDGGVPPTWKDFEEKATTCQVIEDVVKTTVSGEAGYCMGNMSQNAGQTNYLFDVRSMAVANLPQFGYSGITPINDGYMYAYDCWMTPFKPYTFGLGVYNGKIVFKWYGSANLITPVYTDQTIPLVDEPTLSETEYNFSLNGLSVNYFDGVFPITTSWSAPTPDNFKVVPCVMDDKIALNINWFMPTSNTNDPLGNNFACQNTYRDDTTISGGTTEDDIYYEGILNKYYHTYDKAEGESEEPVFEKIKVLIRERTYLQSTHLNGVGDPILTWKNDGAVDTRTGKLSDNFVSDFDGTVIAPCTANDLNNGGDLEYFKQAFKDHSCEFPKGQMSVPFPDFPQNSIHSYYHTVYNPEDSNSQSVGTYLKSGYTSNDSSAESKYINASTFQPSFATETTTLDDEFYTQYMANYDGCKNNEAVEIKWHDDGLLHIYDIWIDEPSYEKGVNSSGGYDYPTNQITFAITYNGRYLTEEQSGITNKNAYSPYYFWQRINTYYGGTGQNYWYPYYYYFQNYGFATIKGSANGFYDNAYTWLATFPCVDDRGYIYNIDEAPPVIYCFACETPYKTGDNNVYRNDLMIMTNAENFADTTYAGNRKQYLYAISIPPYVENNDNRNVENPMDKGRNGKIPTENPNANMGDGADSTNPNSHGTNRRHAEIDTPIPPKSTNILATKLINMYVINQQNMSKLAGDLFSNNVFEQIEHGVNKPLDCVLRFAETRISPLTESSDSVVKLGVCNTSAMANRCSKDYRDIPCSSVIIDRINGDYTDGEERLEVYLPYIGFKTLDNSVLQMSELFLDYRFNFLNGKCIATLTFKPRKGNELYNEWVKNGKGGKYFLTQFTGDFITTYPIGSTSNTGMLSLLTSTGLGLVSGNAYYVRSAVRSLPNSVTPTYEHCGDFGTNLGTSIDRITPYLRKYSICHIRPTGESTSKKLGENESGAINGETSYKSLLVSQVNKKSYIQCDNFELKATPTSITADECDMLKNLFNEGVWKE